MTTARALERQLALDHRRAAAVLLGQDGWPVREIASRLGIAPSTVRDDLHAAGAWKAYSANEAARRKQRAEKEAPELEVISAEPVVARCAYCNFVARGDVGEARLAFIKHRCKRPPPPAKSARSRPRGRGFRVRK